MNRDLYFYGKVFLSLGVFSSTVYSIIFLLIGPKIIGLNSFFGWLLFTTAIHLAGSLVMLKYYHFKAYRFAFYSGMLGTLAHIFMSAVVIVILASRDWQALHLPGIWFGLVTAMVYATSLIISPAGRNQLLRIAGILMLCLAVVYASALLWGAGRISEVGSTLVRIDQWTKLLSSLIPLLFIFQFSRESAKLVSDTQPGSTSKTVESFLGLAGVIAFVCTIFFAGAVAKDGISSLRWDKVNEKRAQRLVDLSETRTFSDTKGDSLRYLLMKPLDYDSTKNYPLVVCLPYGGYQAPPANLLSEEQTRRNYPAFLFIPYAKPRTSWGGTPEEFPFEAKDKLLYEALMALGDPGIDRDRIYVSGVSLGGYGSWHLIGTHPELFAAAIPVCGGGNPELARNIVNVAVWAFHGARDVNVPVSGSRDMIEAIKSAGGDPRYTEFGHLAHNIWYDVSRTPGLLDWLFAQQKSDSLSAQPSKN